MEFFRSASFAGTPAAAAISTRRSRALNGIATKKPELDASWTSSSLEQPSKASSQIVLSFLLQTTRSREVQSFAIDDPHSCGVNDLSFTPKGPFLLSASSDKTVKVIKIAIFDSYVKGSPVLLA